MSRADESDIDEISRFLEARFDAPPGALFASPELLRWKYLESGASGLDEAAFILGADGDIVAHAGWRAATFAGLGDARLQCGTIIDWAAEPRAPGAGIALYRHLMGQAPASYLIGGTTTTQAVAERLGFKRMLRARVYARWLHPFDEFLRRPKTARSALRLLHGVAHVPLDRMAPTGDWSVVRVESFDESVSATLATRPRSTASAERSIEALNHRLRNPATTALGHVLLRNGVVAGCAVSASNAWSARILGVYGAIDSADDLASVYSLLTKELARDATVCRVSVLSSTQQSQQALVANGYWVNRVEPVSFYDPSGRVAALGPVAIQYFDTDLDDYGS